MPAIITEIRYRNGATFDPSGDYVEVRVPTGSDVSDISVEIYNNNGTLRSTNELDGLTPTTVGNFDYYVVVARINRFGAVGLVEDGDVTAFVSFDDTVTATGGTAAGPPALTSVQVGTNGTDDTASLSSRDGVNFFVNPDPDPGAPTCFVAGTLIQLQTGSKFVEELSAGDLVLCMDGVHRPVRRVLLSHIGQKALLKNPKLRPVRIAAGSLGCGLPHRDLSVSRQHRMIVRSKIVERMFDVGEALVPAAKLIGLPGVELDETCPSVTYVHLLFDRHEIVYAEGAPTESLFPGPEALKSVSPVAQREILAIFPELAVQALGPEPAAFIPPGKLQKKLISRHRQNVQPLLM